MRRAPADSASEPGIDAKVAFLRRPESWPGRVHRVEVVETHMAWVFLTERHAYKLKKPRCYGGVDLRISAQRRHDCREELRLNRRLAAEVYLGIRELTWHPESGLAVDGAGAAVDWLVWMRRLPAERMLDARIASGPPRRHEVLPAARLLARFFARAEPAPLGPAEHRKRLAEGIEADRAELLRPEFGMPADRVEALAERQARFAEREVSLFERRVAEGRVVEGHGDLRPEHVCLAPEPVVIDCLEFSQQLRTVDAADELAFLALECERLGAPEVGRWFLEVYREESGDDPPAALLRFYRSYRAMRRASIALWHLDDVDVAEPDAWPRLALRYLELADPPVV